MAYPQYNRYLGGYAQPQNMGVLQYLIAQILAGGGQPQATQAPATAPVNPYFGHLYAPSPMGLSPIARYRDMENRRAAERDANYEAGKAAVAQVYAQQAEQEAEQVANNYAIMSGGIVPTIYRDKQVGGQLEDSSYGTGFSTFLPPGKTPHGLFTTSTGMKLPMTAPANDPMALTFRQEETMANLDKQRKELEDINKKLGIAVPKE